MKRLLYLFIFASLLLTLTACAHKPHVTNPEATGSMPFLMSLAPVLNEGFHVSRVNVLITKGDFSSDMDLLIDSTTAGGTFEDLEPGIYAINISVYDDTLLIATGQGTGTVTPGQTTTVHITLQFIPGGLEVVINWGLPYEDSRRVLFVGNSHTYYNGGVDTHLQSLINEAHPDWGVVVDSHTAGGYTLENHFNDASTISAIATGNWDLVFLQEHSSRPMSDPQLFYQYATALDSVITHNGGLTGLYMTWEWGNNPEMFIPIRDAYNYIGAYLDALVVPAGIAFHTSAETNPTLNLYSPDNSHASLYGTYLVSCLMLASIWNVNPVGNRYIPAGIDPAIAAFLQNLAWDTIQTYHNGKHTYLRDRQPYEAHKPAYPDMETLFQLAM